MAAEEPIPEDLEIADELIAERRAEAPGETPEDMTAWQRPITAVIDVVNYRAGQMIALLMIPLIAVVVYEVISRNLDTVLIDAGFGNLAKALGLPLTFIKIGTSADVDLRARRPLDMSLQVAKLEAALDIKCPNMNDEIEYTAKEYLNV